MRELRNWNGATAQGLRAVAALCLLAAPAAAQTFLSPGDSGQIQYSVQHLTDSGGNIENLTLAVSSAPAYFTVQTASILGPVTTTPGQTTNFVISYQIAADAPAGAFSLVLHLSATTPDVDPDLDTQDVTITFPTRNVPFLVGRRDSAVSGEARVVGPKFGSERLYAMQERLSEPLYGTEGREQAFGAARIAAGPGRGAQPRLSGQKHRFYRLAALADIRKAHNIASIGQDSVQRLAKPSAYRPQGGKPTVCSLAGRFINAGSDQVGSLALASPRRIPTYGLPVEVARRAVGALASPIPAVGAKLRDVSRQAGSRRAVGARADDVAEVVGKAGKIDRRALK